MPIRKDAVTRHGNDPSTVSEFTQPEHDSDPGQTCSDKSNRRVGIQSRVCFRRPCVVAIQTRIGGCLGDSRKRSWIEVSGCQNDQVGPQLASVIQREHGPGILLTDVNNCCDLLFDWARRFQERLDVPPKYRPWSEGLLRRSRIIIPAKPMEEVIWLIGQRADLPRGNIQQVAEAR